MEIEILHHSDINLISELQPAEWYDIMPTIDYYTKTDFCFPIKITIDKKIVGIGTAIIHNDIAWLGHIIVHPENRNQGIGKLITQTLIDIVQLKNCDTIYLIATELGEPVYKKSGFETETEYLFFKDIKTVGAFTIFKNIVAYTDNFSNQLSHLDKQVSGEDRMFHLEQHLSGGFIYLQDDIVKGFYLPTFGEGLISAITDSAGLELMKLRLTTKETASFPVDNVTATEFMHQNNFKEYKTAKRMRLGTKKNWKPAYIYNRIGGNLG
ncbi:MAG: GNAT family N-acetyltransferase [Bacteroidota bacterium]